MVVLGGAKAVVDDARQKDSQREQETFFLDVIVHAEHLTPITAAVMVPPPAPYPAMGLIPSPTAGAVFISAAQSGDGSTGRCSDWSQAFLVPVQVHLIITGPLKQVLDRKISQ